ncbi:MAG: hypothetical protein M0D57_04240 [Sphingobacteriales bacterium JAD_PAG50586_3]|nr:MAG: hypothetical protein M0D57_04240 [Sphingobacteriales bacterium JAD_PAG50586_3]
MRRIGVLILILVGSVTGLGANSTIELIRPTNKLVVYETQPSFELEPEKKKRKSPKQGALRVRSKIFTVNILRFNKKIRAKHDKETKALARYEERLKKRNARKHRKDNPVGFEVKIKRKAKGPAVRQRKNRGN